MEDFYQLGEAKQNMVFQLMELIGNNNIELAQAILQQNGWDLESSLESFLNHPPSPTSPPPSSSSTSNVQNFKTVYPNLKVSPQLADLLMKRHSSSTPHQDFVKIQQYAEKLARDNPKYRYTVERSQRQIENNRRFIEFLMKECNGVAVDFEIGSFASNLMKAWVKRKPMLVYVHSTSPSASAHSILTRILRDPAITTYINRNFIVYGLFDNSPDYSFIQPNLPPTMLPGFAVYVYDEKTKAERCLGAKGLLKGQGVESLVDWLAGMLAKEKYGEKFTGEVKDAKESYRESARESERNLKDEQQEAYDKMEQEFKLKREQSKLKKIDLEQAKANAQHIQKQFLKEPPAGPGIIEIRFRMPVTGKLIPRRFEQKQKVHRLFAFVEGFCSQEFETQYGDFDLVQTYPPQSLLNRKQQTLQKVFEGSQGQTLIIKQL